MAKNAVLQFAQQAAVLALKSKSKDPPNNDITRGRTNEEVRAHNGLNIEKTCNENGVVARLSQMLKINVFWKKFCHSAPFEKM